MPDLSCSIQNELASGLSAAFAHISPKYFYDRLGSVLFEAICELPEYYPTRVEAAIFTKYAAEMAQAIGSGSVMIDLGAGNCAKAASLFPKLHPAQYVPIDISGEHLHDAVARLQQRFPHIEMTPCQADFSAQLQLPEEVRSEHRLFFYPGSSIGNFEPATALQFLRQLRAACNKGKPGNPGSPGNMGCGILIGVDLVKPDAVLNAAYDDVLGVTAAFNLNSLRHVNHLLGSDFDLRQWQHLGFFNATQNRIEMHLQARTAQTVTWPGGQRHFAAGERIHTENSYKYTMQSFLDLLEQAGFGRAKYWCDEKRWFAVFHAHAI